jgi:2-polyprenyl-3-methyl-5-hydroxy-6-metoxy-1,4-benzoquinol methylase
MEHITSCPVCQSGSVSRAYEAGTNRQQADPARWNVFSCQQCSHGYMNPQPTWDELTPYYAEDYDPYIENHGAESAQDAQTLAEARASGSFRHLPTPNGKRVLDVGCGAGWFLRICKQLGAETFGIEPSVFGAQRSRAQGLAVFNGMVDDYLAAHGDAEKFDVITANHVVEHSPLPVQMLQSMARLLAPGGTLWISVPNADCYFSRELRGAWHSADLPYHLQQFSPQSLERAGQSAGLVSTRVYTYSLPAATAASMCHLLRRRYWVPQRISMNLGVLKEQAARRVAARLDQRNDGEAVIAEFKLAA